MNDTKLAGALALVGGLLLMVLTPVLVLVLIVMVAVAAVESLAPDVGNLGDSVAGATTQCQPVGIRPLTVSGRTTLSADIDLTAQQVTNAAIVIGVGRNRGIDEDLIQIAVQVAWGESRLKNLANDGSFTYPAGSRVMTATQWAAARTVAMTSLNLPHDGIGSDWDSVGLFQQRPQAGWGTVPELMDPATAATKFYDAALRVDGVESMTDIEVVRAVQRNVNPETYAQYRAMARDLLLDRALGCEPLGVSLNRPGFRSVLEVRMEPDEPEVFTGDA